MAAAKAEKHKSVVHVTAADLQGPGVVFCPNPKMPLWSGHPKVYLDMTHGGAATCAYCGTHYVLDGPAPKGH
jgi:uncharacterized Zn-finger protein